MKNRLFESQQELAAGNASYFARRLPSAEIWRLFPQFRSKTAYLDIETDGGPPHEQTLTTIALYDGKKIRHYVEGRNLDEFPSDIMRYDVLVTYNGKSFDIPFLERFFRIKIDKVQIDLRFLLKSLGYRGGLKGCERQVGIDRKDLAGVNGYTAVLLWRDYVVNGNEKALETLLAYNILDAVNLETLLVIAYNLNLAKTPFLDSHQLKFPEVPDNTFRADRETLDRVNYFMQY